MNETVQERQRRSLIDNLSISSFIFTPARITAVWTFPAVGAAGRSDGHRRRISGLGASSTCPRIIATLSTSGRSSAAASSSKARTWATCRPRSSRSIRGNEIARIYAAADGPA